MSNRFIQILYKMSPWHFLWIGILASELLTIISSFIASNMLWGKISEEIIIIGLIDALVASFPVIFIIIFFVSKINREKTVNDQLMQEIEQRKLLEVEREKLLIKLGHAHKMESVGTLATGIAHEINQPLTFVKIIFESVKKDIQKNQLNLVELEEDCDESLKQIMRITIIIDHLRSFGREDAVLMSEVELGNILDNTLILLGQRMKLKNIEFESEIEENLPTVIGNSLKLEQILINLFQNSFDALEGEKDSKIIVSMYKEKNKVKITFADNGKGVPKDLHDKIFEPFFTTKEIGRGTGLGLSIVYSIIQEHNGEISYIGGEKGSTFLITLPQD